jgi:hypothetical protein
VREGTSGLLPGWTRTAVRRRTTTKTYGRKPNRLQKREVVTESVDIIDEFGVPIPRTTRTTKVRGKKPVVDDWDYKKKVWVRRRSR